MRFIRESYVRKNITFQESNYLVKQSFCDYYHHKVSMPSKVYLNTPLGDFRAMPASAAHSKGFCGLKWISVYPFNSRKKLPVVNGIYLLNDAKTGQALAAIEANTLTAYRTGSAGAIASKFLAHPKSSAMLVVGAGLQSYYQIRCHLQYFNLKKIYVWSPSIRDSNKFIHSTISKARQIFRRIEFIPIHNLQEGTQNADIICTCTPSTKPLIMKKGLNRGVHINAIGADAPGKQELHIDVLKSARVIVDDINQASTSGEINVGFKKGLLSKRNISCNLPELLARPTRRSQLSTGLKKYYTVFDSTGLAIQDLYLAIHVYKKHISQRNSK